VNLTLYNEKLTQQQIVAAQLLATGELEKKRLQSKFHYIMIADIYLQMMKYHKITHFEIEPFIKEVKLIPDIFAIWGNSLWWIEAQNSIYSSKQMYEKLNKYQELLQSGGYKELSFQPRDKKIFPNVTTDNLGEL
jgi:Replication-relaxation